jgi:abequosyltransferase
MSVPPFLSVCVPTYNRASFLRECLESVLESAAGHPEVEILVVDNASTDDTPALIAHFQQHYPQVRYHRHAANIGGENNFYAAAQLASGEYVWLLGDDDKLLPHAIPVALRYLEQGYDFLISNFSVWTIDFSAIKLKNMMPLRYDTLFHDPNHLMASLGVQLAYISATIIKKALFLAPPRAEYDTYAEYGMAFMYAVYASLATHCYGLYLSDPLLCNRDNSGGWSEEAWNKVFITGTRLTLARLQQLGYSPDATYAAQERLLRDYVLRTILGRVRDGKNVRPLLGLMLPDFKRYWFFWAACVPATLMPPFLLQLATGFVRWRRAKPEGASAGNP